jgi:hypothetical protein
MVNSESDDVIKAEVDFQYKKALLSLLKRKKYDSQAEKPDTLITKYKKLEKFD